MKATKHQTIKNSLVVLLIFCTASIGLCYYFIPRNVSFRLVKEFYKPTQGFDASRFIGFNMAESDERLYYWLTDYLKNHYDNAGYDSIFVKSISQSLDYKNNDYIVTYQKTLVKLQYSPHLAKTRDGLYFDKRVPLIPVWDTTITDKIYIYEIPKRNYRSPGP